MCWRGIPSLPGSLGATEHSCWDPHDPKPARTRSGEAAAREPEAGVKASAWPGQMEDHADGLPLQGVRSGLINPGNVLPESRALSTSAPPLSGKGPEKLSV